MRKKELLSAGRRSVLRFNDENLLLGEEARRQQWDSLLLINPTLAMWTTNPMNLAALDEHGHILWILPVDCRRLTVTDTSEAHRLSFGSLWMSIDQLLKQEAESKHPFWAVLRPVGRPPSGWGGDWVEYFGPRPWLEIGSIEGSPLSIVAALNTDPATKALEKGSVPYQCMIPASAVHAWDEPLRSQDGYVELAHFAVLDPGQEKLHEVGTLEPEALNAVRLAMRRWPQRSRDSTVKLV